MQTIRIFGLALLCALAVGCGGGDGDGSSDANIENVQLRVVHASSDAGPVDIYVTGPMGALIEDFAYGDTTDFLTIPAGVYDIDVRPAGAPDTSTPVFSASGVPVTSSIEVVTVVAAGLVGAPAGSGQEFRLLTLVHDFDTPAAGQAIVRIVHASPGAGPVKIDVGDDAVSEVQLLPRFDDTGESGVALPAGAMLQVGIRDANTDARITAFTTPALPEGAEIFVFATGLPSLRPGEDEGFRLLAVGPAGTVGFVLQNPIVYALHAGVDAPAVRVFTDTTPLSGPISFGELSGPIQVPPGMYPISLNVASNDAVALAGMTPALAAGDQWLAVARGFESAPNALEIDFVREAFVRDDTSALVQVLHASPDAPDVELGAVDMGMFSPLGLPALTYGDSTDASGVPLPLVPFELGLRVPGQQDAAVSFDVSASAGNRIVAAAIGSLLDQAKPGFRIALILTETSPWTLATLSPK